MSSSNSINKVKTETEVNTTILIKKEDALGITGISGAFFISFFSCRKQFYLVNGHSRGLDWKHVVYLKGHAWDHS